MAHADDRRTARALAGDLNPATLAPSFGSVRNVIWVLLAVTTDRMHRTSDPGATPPTRALAPEALPERPLSTPLDGARIIVNAPAGTDGAATAAAMDALQAAKPGSLTRADARVTIRESNVRYFHPADLPAAVEVAARLSPVLGSTPAIRDFTDFTPRPSEGAIEVWLEGDAPAFTARRVAPQPGPADIVMETVRRARDTLERAVDALPDLQLR